MPAKVRIAAKQVENRLLAVAQNIKDNPNIVIPECVDSCSSCPFEKLKKEIDRLKDDSYAEKMARKKGFVAAVASTMLLTKQKIPYVGFMKIDDENVYYAKRGKVKDELLVGLQHWDNPRLRLLAYFDIARKKKVNLFSLAERIICAKKVPKEFFEFIDTIFMCNIEEFISIKWQGHEIRACSTRNTVADMRHYFYYPDFEKEVEISVHVPPVKCQVTCETCHIKEALHPDIDIPPYLHGQLSDKDFIKRYRTQRQWRSEKGKIFMIGNNCYGADEKAFLQTLQPKSWELEAVEEILRNEPKAIILEQPSAPKLLEQYGVNITRLQMEHEEKEREETLSVLPKIDGNSRAHFIDLLARAQRVEGKDGVMKSVKNKKLDVKEKIILYAFLCAMDVESETWKYTTMERDFGKHLAEHVKKLFNSEGSEYVETIQLLVRELG